MTLREFLAELDGRGELVDVADPIAAEFEVSALLSLLDGDVDRDGGPAVRMSNVDGHAVPVVGNVFTSRDRLGDALGSTGPDLHEHVVAALSTPIPPRVVATAPWQEVVVDEPDLRAELPVPTFFEGEGGPYLTAGVFVANDPQTGAANLSIARIRLLDGARCLVGIAPNHHLAAFARRAATDGRELPVAVCLGVEPAVLLASCLYLALGEDELPYAGGLARSPVEVVERTGLRVPAECEIVLEAVIHPDELVDEGPVSEFHGMYESYGPAPVLTVRRLCRRRDAFLQVIEPGLHREHIVLGAAAIEAGLARTLRRQIPAVRAVRVTDEGAGRLAARVALGPHRAGEAKRVMFAVWAAVSLVRSVVVVDEDLDLADAFAIDRATTLRVRPERDILIVADVVADRADPLSAHDRAGRLGVDATRNPEDRDWTPARPPDAVTQRIQTLAARLRDVDLHRADPQCEKTTPNL